MPKFRHRVVAVLTVIALASFVRALGADENRDAGGAFAAFRENAAWTAADGALSSQATALQNALDTRLTLADSVTSLEFRGAEGAHATLLLMGRYAVPVAGNGEWQKLSVKLRAPRFDAGYNKQSNALALEIRTGQDLRRNVVFDGASPGARWPAEDMRGPSFFVIDEGAFAVRNARHDAADFTAVTVPAASGGETNEKSLIDIVARGKELFTSVGCEACHRVERDSQAVSTGPNLYGLFRVTPRTREIVEGDPGHRFQVKVNREYLYHSVRAPGDQLAVAESGATRGSAFPAAMPAFTKEIISDEQVDAVGAYLATLNDPGEGGPVILLGKLEPVPPYDPMGDSLQWLVNDRVRLQRGPLAGTSARAIHVGNPNGVNYSFDPRLLAIVKIWQGGFLDMSGELTNRGGRGLALGYESRELGFGDQEYLLAPLNAAGRLLDSSFKNARFGDSAAIKESLYSKEDQFARIAALDAQFLGYSRDSRSKVAAPVFRYRVAKNLLEVATSIGDDGAIEISVTGTLASPQGFALNSALLAGASVSAGSIAGNRWTLPAGRATATLRGRLSLGARPWRPAPSNYAFTGQVLAKAAASARLPAGYSIENYYPPKDNYGREQLFEALGLSLAKDGTVVVATRTAGIWRLVNGEWRPFAEGLFDSLGVVAEDGKGLTVVAGQKAELTRISDTNGDGLADRYDTLFDANSYHGNYHNYLHGPVRAKDGSYYFTINLVHDNTGLAYTGGGNVMGSWGGFSGWAIHLKKDGSSELFANGMRSPASLGVGPDGRLWYADNQGDFVGTSKLFELRKDAFYGHPAGLVDLPGMTPDSPEIKWERVAARKEHEVILFPHNRVANSPGNPAWDLTHGRFGPFGGQMMIGDQTQSNLLRVVTQKVGEVEQGCVIPFLEGLESGVMRPLFLSDGSLLLGQTGRGWQAKGGKVASLQHVRWDGKTVAPAVLAMTATAHGFRIGFTQPLGKGVSNELLRAALLLESWTYRDAPDYGSPELALREETPSAIKVSPDRMSLDLQLATLDVPQTHPRQTARVYHLKLGAQALFDLAAPAQLEAYYTLRRFPASNETH
jgi:mono/diheme cytochrome c family protein